MLEQAARRALLGAAVALEHADVKTAAADRACSDADYTGSEVIGAFSRAKAALDAARDELAYALRVIEGRT